MGTAWPLIGAWMLFGNVRGMYGAWPSVEFVVEPNYALPLGVVFR